MLERRGHGWGEEIIPHLVVEERPIAAKKRSPVGVPAPWEVCVDGVCVDGVLMGDKYTTLRKDGANTLLYTYLLD